MIIWRLAFITAIVVAGCGGRTTVVQSGGPAPVVPAAAAKKAPVAAWYDTIRPLATLGKGWNRIPGRTGTGCAHDSAFSFKVLPGLPDKVLIFLNGGGACWRAADCDPHGHPTYTMTVDSANDVSVRAGVFDVGNEKNPLRDFTMVFVPSCTGDAHLGTRETEYEHAKGTFSVRHGGGANIEAMLDWVYTNLRRPAIVVVAGVNTGGIATPVVAEKVQRHYPRASVVQLADGSGGLRAEAAPVILAGWGAADYLADDPAFRSLDSSEVTFEQLYVGAAHVAPRVHYAQVNAADDASQVALLAQLGVKAAPLRCMIAANYAALRDSVPWFHTYTTSGRASTMLRSNALYTAKVGGVPFRDWLESLVNFESVEDVGDRLLATTATKKK